MDLLIIKRELRLIILNLWGLFKSGSSPLSFSQPLIIFASLIKRVCVLHLMLSINLNYRTMCMNPSWLPDENQYEPCFDCPECISTISPQDIESTVYLTETAQESEEAIALEMMYSEHCDYEDLPF